MAKDREHRCPTPHGIEPPLCLRGVESRIAERVFLPAVKGPGAERWGGRLRVPPVPPLRSAGPAVGATAAPASAPEHEHHRPGERMFPVPANREGSGQMAPPSVRGGAVERMGRAPGERGGVERTVPALAGSGGGGPTDPPKAAQEMGGAAETVRQPAQRGWRYCLAVPGVDVLAPAATARGLASVAVRFLSPGCWASCVAVPARPAAGRPTPSPNRERRAGPTDRPDPRALVWRLPHVHA